MASGLSLNIDTTKSEFQNPMVELRQGDGNYQSLRVTVTSNGEPLMLDGWTISFMGTTAGGHKIVDSDTHVINASNGVFDYTPTKAWGQDIGEFDKAYFKFTNGNESASGANFRVKVFEAVDLTDEEAGNYISVVDVMIDKIKTDMDNKLADTQKTLSDTQSQATSVQGNVNDLNNNVNDLKAQNNAIKSTDNTWTGTNTFEKPIQGGLGVRIYPFNTIAALNGKLVEYSGQWGLVNGLVTDLPKNGYAILTVYPHIDNGSAGFLTLQYTDGDFYFSAMNGANVEWKKVAKDSEVMHLTGNETIAGDKTLTGSTTFTQPISGSLETREATFSKFSDIADDLVNHSGDFYVWGNTISDSPIGGEWLQISINYSEDNSGTIRVTGYSSHKLAFGIVEAGTIDWIIVPRDASVMHNTGNETAAGDKTFTGNVIIQDANPVKVKQSATVEFNSWQSSKMKATRFGNIVSLRYSVNPDNDNKITKNQTSAVVIPVGFRPMEPWNMAVGGVSSGSNVLVNPDGTLTSGWQDVQYAGMMTAMYFTTDPFPS